MNTIFRKFAKWVSSVAGSPYVFVFAIVIVGIWALMGPMFGYSDSWQLVINTGTTILTFLMVFLIQNTQNRDSHAVHLKLDELIKAVDAARNQLIDIEDNSDEVIATFEEEFESMRVNGEEKPQAKSPKVS